MVHAQERPAEVWQEGEKVLSNYYDFYQEKFTIPLFLERDYNRIRLYFDDIPVSELAKIVKYHI